MAFLVHSHMHWQHGPMENTFCVWPRMKSIKVKEKEYKRQCGGDYVFS